MKRLLSLLFAILLAITTGCESSIFEGIEDQSTDEAKRVEIARLLDKGEYDAVLNSPFATPLDIAAAAIGKAGLDSTNLLNSLVDIADSATKNDLSPITEALPINPLALEDLDFARTKLLDERNSKPDDPDLNFQMVMLSLADIVTLFAEGVEKNGGDPRDGISSSEAQSLGDELTGNPGLVDVNRVSQDVIDVLSFLPNADLGPTSDFAQAVTEIVSGSEGIDSDGNGTVTSTEVSNYLKNVLGP
jgi:hypothetical protein